MSAITTELKIHGAEKNNERNPDHHISLLPHHCNVEHVQFTFTFLTHTNDEFIIQSVNHYAATTG